MIQRPGIFLLAVIALAYSSAPHAAAFYAGQITESNQSRLPDGGLAAIGGLGDWILTDGDLCAVISDVTHTTYLSLNGGALVDLWHCDLANDEWTSTHTQLNLRQEQIPLFDNIAAGYTDAQAWVEVSAQSDGLETRVRYLISAQQTDELVIQTTINRLSDGADLSMFGSLALHPSASLIPFAVGSAEGIGGAGFNLPLVDTSDIFSLLQSITTPSMQVLMGSRHRDAPISYGLPAPTALLHTLDGQKKNLPTFMINGREFSMFGSFTQPFPSFWTEQPGMFSFALGQLFDMRPGEIYEFRQSIQVGRSAQVSQFTDTLYRGHTISGQLDAAEAGILVSNAKGTPLTFTRPDQTGTFSFKLPQYTDDFSLQVKTSWSDKTIASTAGADLNLGRLRTGTPGRLSLPQGEPVSLLFLRSSGQHVFHSEMTTLNVAGEPLLIGPENTRLNLAGTPSDPTSVDLAPGSYRILASRGPEFTVTEAQIDIAANKQTSLEIDMPQRAVATPGVIGADLHVHSGVSFDSSLQPQQRIRDFVAQGGEVLVPTEHNVSYDINPVIDAMGLSDVIHSFPGIEITGMIYTDATPVSIGHSNAFPVKVDDSAFMGGAPQFEGKRLGRVIDQYKAHFAGSIFQLNHPRSLSGSGDLTFFDHLSLGSAFDPSKPLEAPANRSLLEAHLGSDYRDIDFDAIELLNGASMERYERVRRDWFALLKQNFYKVATANSDSHLSSEMVAYPRSYLVVEEDDPANIETQAVLHAIKSGALYGSTGPLLEVSLDGAGPGETFRGKTGKLQIKVQSAPWIEVQEIRLWRNDELWQSVPLPASGEYSADISVESDSFIFVEVFGDATEIYQNVLPGFTPFAFANPIFVDTKSDGWQFGQGE